jgi:hypothetical protein
MFGSAVLDTALGLAFLYLLLSLLVTGLNELIEAGLKKRAKNLELGLRELLGRDGQLLDKLYNHPILFGLFLGEKGTKDARPPSYIPARSFALALMDLLCPAGPGWPSGTDGATADRPAGAAPPAAPSRGLETLRAALEARRTPAGLAIPDHLAQGILALLDAGANDAVRVRENIEAWFNATMDRVSGWYKRRMQWVTAVVGLALAVGLNADTFAVVDALVRDPALRASVTAAAEASVKAHPPGDGAAGDKAGKKEPEKSDAKAAEPPPTPRQIAKEINDVRGYGWPVGWDRGDPRTMPPHDSYGSWGLKFAGWIVTAFAIMLGAPFWFDTLNKIIVIRSTVKPTEKSPNEPPVDRR